MTRLSRRLHVSTVEVMLLLHLSTSLLCLPLRCQQIYVIMCQVIFFPVFQGMDFYEFWTSSALTHIFNTFFHSRAHFILRLCACNLKAQSFYWRNDHTVFSHSDDLTPEWQWSILVSLIKSGKSCSDLKDYCLKWNKDRLCTTSRNQSAVL